MVERIASGSATPSVLGRIEVSPPPAPAAPQAETPLAPVSLPRRLGPPRENSSSSVNAVLLGLAAIPAAAIAILAPFGAEAQAKATPPDTAEATRLARSELFAARRTAEDPHVTELVQKITTLVNNRFGGNTQAAFNHYAGADGQVSESELSKLLSDAGIGNFLTRGAWVDGIMERVDTSHNGKISWTEFQTVMSSTTPRAA